MTWCRSNDVRKFDADAILFREIQCLSDVLMQLRLKSCKTCKNNDHTCLFHCNNTCPVPWTIVVSKMHSNEAIIFFLSIGKA